MNPQIEPRVQEGNVLDYVRVVTRHWKLVPLICIPSVVAMAVWSLVMTETFRATTSIVPPSQSTGGDLGLVGGLMGGGEGAFLRKAMNMSNVADMYVGILGSRAVLDAIVDRFNLVEVYGCSECRWKALDWLQGKTQIKVGEEGIVEISVVDVDPVRAAAIANAYVEELDRQNKRLSAGQATSKRLFLENRLKEIEEKFSRIESLSTREMQVQEMLYELLIREYELAKIEEAKSMPTIQVLDEAVPPTRKFEPHRRQMVTMAGAGSFTLAAFLAFFLEYREETRQTGLARQFQRATRWRKAAPRRRAGESGNNGQDKVAVEEVPGHEDLVARP
jgi:uncharacterized protein involved in exopolysaccharide biosynthesis